MNKNVEAILISQIEKEGFSSNLYLAMASWAENQGFEGTSSWLYIQADEEKLHMLKIIKYINERDGYAIIPAFKKPDSDFKDIKNMFNMVLKHEEFITASINKIVAVCYKEEDFTTVNWIQWFVMEQIQEEKSVRAILDKMNLSGNDNMYLFDKDVLGMRTPAGPAQTPA